MRSKKLLAGLLAGIVIVCLIPVMGYGYLFEPDLEKKALQIDVDLLEAELDYIMENPTSFQDISIFYDFYGISKISFPSGATIKTKDKIVVYIYDSRSVFAGKSGADLLTQFRKELWPIYDVLKPSLWGQGFSFDTDVVAKFYTGIEKEERGQETFLGYFYQGEYHLWEPSATLDKPEIVEPKAQKERDFEAEIKAYAKKEWPDDYRMQAYECEKQLEALKQIQGLPSTVDYNESILSKAIVEWGENYRMVMYEYNKQLEAYKEMR